MKFLMRLVAVHAGHGPRFVRAASPEKLVSSRMALQASEIFLSDCILGIFSKADRNRVLASACLDVHTARTVTRFATTSLVGSVRMRHCLSHCGSVETAVLILVTGNTGIAPDIIAIRFGVGTFSRLPG